MGEEAYDEIDLPAAHPRKPNDERTLCVRGGYSRTEVYVGICRTKYDDPDEIIAVDGAALKRALHGMQIGPPLKRRELSDGLTRIRAVVEDTKLSPTAALDTIRAILEEE